MRLKNFLLCLILLNFLSSGCTSIFAPPTSTPIPTHTATFTPLPTNTPVPTDTPTVTPLPTETPTTEPSPTFPPPPKPPTNTPKPRDAILVYYFNLDEKGPFGCGEALYFLNTGVRKSDDYPGDISYALRTILNYHSPYIGILYNPGYASILSVGQVAADNAGNVAVNLTGTYVPTDDYCDGVRFKDQLRQTILQFTQVLSLKIFINGIPIGNVIKRK